MQLGGLPANLASLMTPEAYPHPVDAVRLIETHVSWVFLAGEFAYKIKRPVCYPFVDMRSPAQRLLLCREELRLNRRFAPELYLDVVPINEDSGRVRILGQGKAVEHAVRMRQFDTGEELDRLVAESRVEQTELAEFGRYLSRIHERLPPVSRSERYGSFAAVAASMSENLVQVESLSRRAGLQIDGAAIGSAVRSRLQTAGPLIDARRDRGRVRECHGDLHCRNVVRNSGRLVAFDGLEFEPAFRWIDVAEEIAFLYMDLAQRGGFLQANAFLNAYFVEGGDYEAAQLLPLYGAHRALVRAKVAALETEGAAAQERERHASDHRAYVECARNLLAPKRPPLILMTGLSGSGKTWLAQRLAPRLGAIHVRSDVERKRLKGLSARESSRSGLGQSLYAQEMNDSTYRRLARCASDILAGGFVAIVDATFQRRADRALVSRLSLELNVPLVLVRCRAPAEVLRTRILDRARKGDDSSEANLAVLEHQQALFESVDPGEGLEVIDADTTRATIVDELEHALKSRS